MTAREEDRRCWKLAGAGESQTMAGRAGAGCGSRCTGCVRVPAGQYLAQLKVVLEVGGKFAISRVKRCRREAMLRQRKWLKRKLATLSARPFSHVSTSQDTAQLLVFH